MSEALHIKWKLLLSVLPNFLYFPFILIWSILYGGCAGILFKLLAVYERWRDINHLQILLWKKYPQRSYRKFITTLWANQVKGNVNLLSIELTEYSRSQIETNFPTEPFPLLRMLSYTVFMLSLTPFMALSGLVKGPVYVFNQSLANRAQSQLRFNPALRNI